MMQSIQVLVRGARVLEFVAAEPERPKTLGEIAARVGLNTATCARILGTLVRESYVEQIGYKGAYILGPMAYALAARGPYRKDLVGCARTAIDGLARDTGETSMIAILHQHRRFVLYQVEGGRDVQVRPDAILVQDVYPTSTGRVLLAGMNDDDVARFVAECGLPSSTDWPEATTEAKLRARLAAIRKRGFEIRTSPGEVVGVGMPVWQGDAVTAAVGLFLPVHRFKGHHKAQIMEATRVASSEISRKVSLAGGAADGRQPA